MLGRDGEKCRLIEQELDPGETTLTDMTAASGLGLR